jgi:phosphatidate cytidylyltransferase
MNNLTQRIITAAIGATFMIGGLLLNIYSFCIVLFLLSIAVHFEYMKTVQHLKEGEKRYGEWFLVLFTGIYIFILTVLMFLPGLTFKPESALYFILPFIFSLFIYELYTARNQPFQNIALNITGLFYCVLPFLLLCILGITYASENKYQPWLVLGYFFIVWSNDTFAYFIGRAFGKHKLFERISPHKTWEGFFGGVAASLLCGFVLSCFFDFISWEDWLVIGLIVALTGTLGDLTESMLKRSLHIKDSSSILPGHGGFLDRFDATLIAAPVVFTYLMLRI